MSEQFAINLSEIEEPGVQVVTVQDQEIGIFRLGGKVYAYANECVHEGGPVCEGTILGKVEAILRPDKTVAGERFSEDEIHIVCPWHGYEYDIRTGECAPDRRLKLRAFPVSVRGDAVYVDVEREVVHGG